MAKGLNRHQFHLLVDEVKVCILISCCTTVQCLSIGEGLKLFWKRWNFPGQRRAHLSWAGTARVAGKATLDGRYDNAPEYTKIQPHNIIHLKLLESAITAMQTLFGKQFCEFRKEKKKQNTWAFPVTKLTIDPCLLNMTALAGVHQPDLQMELADRTHKDIRVSKLKHRTATLEDAVVDVLAQNYK